MKKLAPIASVITAAAFMPVMAQTTITVSNWLPPGGVTGVALGKWCDSLDKESKGTMKCNTLAKPVSSPPGTFDAIRDGLADVSFTVDGYTPGRFVFTQIAEFPFLGNSAESTSVAYQRVYAKYLAPAGEHRGVKALAVFTHGPGLIFNSKKPITSSSDVSTLKFRVGGGNINELSRAMGWNVTLKPATETFELLSTGVMDGTFFPDDAVVTWKLNMVKHATTFPGGLYNTSFVFMMNQGKYQSLSVDQRAIIDKISGENASRLFGQAWDAVDKASRDGAQKEQGVARVSASDAFVNEIRSKQSLIEDKWASAADAKGLKNAKAILAEFRAEVAKLK